MRQRTGAATASEVLEQEYEHMQTGYFHRHGATKGTPEKGQ